MTRGLNKVLLIGNLGRDPDLRYTPSGKPIATFTLACTRNWITSNGERRDATEWFNIVAWGPLAEICKQHLVKGSRIYIDGHLRTRTWEDQAGQKQTTVEVVAKEMIMLDNRPGPVERLESQPEDLYDDAE
ncbi:MAG: single-stranded DNA-binding protein [Anaerolineales bacterium]|nr:single-stranded DNA-binding protein [Anaerolineae bacterium]